MIKVKGDYDNDDNREEELASNYMLMTIKLKQCRNSMDLPTSTDPHRISLKLATQYWVTVYQK